LRKIIENKNEACSKNCVLHDAKEFLKIFKEFSKTFPNFLNFLKQETGKRPVSLTSLVCKEMEAEYIRQVWEDSDWLHKGQHGFRPGYSCENQIITVCENIADSLDEAD
jgi:hypothetical protein